MHEPLFIDLVRQMDSKTGDLEIKTLYYNENGKAMCAPKIEYVTSNGLAIEFEVSMEETKIEGFKFVIQKQIKT